MIRTLATPPDILREVRDERDKEWMAIGQLPFNYLQAMWSCPILVDT